MQAKNTFPSREYKLKGEKNDITVGELTGLPLYLDEFLFGFRDVLRAGNHNLTEKATTFLKGLFQADKRNIEQISDAVPGSLYQSMHHLISQSPWDDDPVRALAAKKANDHLGNKGTSGLIIDESAMTKKGKQSAGVSRQWSGQLGKRESCQVAVFTALTREEDVCLLDAKLYIPKSWCQDPVRCRQAGIPEDECLGKSKTQLALELVDRADEYGVGYQWVVVDGGYGKEPAFLRGLILRGKTFMADVHKDQMIYPCNPGLSMRKTTPARGGQLLLKRKPIRVDRFISRMPAKSWKKVMIRHGAHGPLIVEVLKTHVWIWDGKEEKPHRCHLLVRRDRKENSYKYSLSNAPFATDLKTLAYWQSQRFKVEQSFQEAKQEIGLDGYQVRSFRGWHHHVSFCILAHLFILEMKRKFRRDLPLLSCRDVRKMIEILLPRITFEDYLRQMHRRHHQRHTCATRPRPPTC